VPELTPWFHNLHPPGGRRTAPDHPLGDFPAFRCKQIAPHLPADLSGARALDIGCNAGFYSFELARRGADVLAIDVDEHYLRQARWAADELGLADRVTLRRLGVYELETLDAEPFDVVLFLGVLYHLRHPLLALDLIAPLVGGRLVVQTLTTPATSAPCRRRTSASTSATRCSSRVGLRWRSSSTSWPATRRTGGPRTRHASRRCCAPAGCGSWSVRGTRCGSASAPERRGALPGDRSWRRPLRGYTAAVLHPAPFGADTARALPHPLGLRAGA
jgi:2-polyprenyl-3-methyl-5-hydroxy-6-metoxy-1,4-benzoquinol methylase